jgi:hypothetical protein
MSGTQFRMMATIVVAILALSIGLGTISVDNSSMTASDPVGEVPEEKSTVSTPVSVTSPTVTTAAKDPVSDAETTQTPRNTVRYGSWPDDDSIQPLSTDDSVPALDTATVPFIVTDVLPGDADLETLTLTNVGNETADVSVGDISISQGENGLTEPEAKVDDSAGGELGALASGRVYFETADSTTIDVVGGRDRTVPIEQFPAERSDASVAVAPNESVTLVVEWAVPSDVGNVVQTDSVSINATVSATRSKSV